MIPTIKLFLMLIQSVKRFDRKRDLACV